MTAYACDSTKVGTALVSAAGTITAISQTAAQTGSDAQTPLVLTDGAGGRTLYAASEIELAWLYAVKPSGPSMAPGLTAPTWPQTFQKYSISFANGIYVKSCPTGLAFTVTA